MGPLGPERGISDRVRDERTVLRERQNGDGYIGMSLLNFGGERREVCVYGI